MYISIVGPLCRHTGLLWQDKLYVFGGQTSSIENSKVLWVFDFVKSSWKQFGPMPNSDQVWPCSVHSHSCNIYTDDEGVDYMITSFGFLGEKIAEHTNEVWAYDLQANTWKNLFAHNQENNSNNIPVPRSGQATAIVKGVLYAFGGDDSERRFNDMWSFNLKSCEWQQINLQGKIIPEVI